MCEINIEERKIYIGKKKKKKKKKRCKEVRVAAAVAAQQQRQRTCDPIFAKSRSRWRGTPRKIQRFSGCYVTVHGAASRENRSVSRVSATVNTTALYSSTWGYAWRAAFFSLFSFRPIAKCAAYDRKASRIYLRQPLNPRIGSPGCAARAFPVCELWPWTQGTSPCEPQCCQHCLIYCDVTQQIPFCSVNFRKM